MDTTQGQVAPQAAQGESGDAPKHVTEEQLNRAITARFKSFEKALEGKFSEFGGGIMGKFEELMKAQQPQPVQAPEVKLVTESPEFKGMQKRMAEMTAKLEAAEKEKAAEREKTRVMSMRQKLAEELVRNGVDASRIKAATALLVAEENRVRVEEDGSYTFVDTDGTEVDLSTGVKSWSKSEDAKIFLPAKNVNGSGSRPAGHANQPQTGQVDKEALGGELLDWLRA